MVDSIVAALIRYAAQVVQSVIQGFTQQMNIVEEQAMNPLKGIVQAVTGGVWRGTGADAFVEEVSNLAIPGVGQVGEQMRTFQGNLQRASDIITQADQKCSQLVQNLAQIFGGIAAGL